MADLKSQIKSFYRWFIAGSLFGCVEAALATEPIAEIGSAALLQQEKSDAMFLLIGFVSMALVISFLCSVAETVLLSITPSYIEGLRDKNPEQARQLKLLRQEQIDRSLAAILTMNTVAHTVGAIEAGAQSAVVFGSTWVGIFSGGMTLMILFLSEIIPKTLGAVYWRKLVGVTQLFIRILIVILYPLVRISEGLTKLITRGKSVHQFNRDEFLAMVGFGQKVGEIDEHESKIIKNLFRLRSLKVTDIMTPRIVITALPQDMLATEAQKALRHCPFSRLPLYGQSIDDITGFALKDKIMLYKPSDREELTLASFKRKLHAVPDSMLLPKLLDFFLNNRQQIAIIVDEYGGVKGLVSLEDVIETLLGMDIVDETDNVADMQALARQQWVKRAEALGFELPEELLGTDEDKEPREGEGNNN
ncbi:MAG: HlyC/CorC family transporter [Porticoccus sp.]|nr:HlyC/CorC family transporter [Porticoccus sp.]